MDQGARPHPLSVIVVGGGAAGIAAAYYLRRAGCRVELIEAGTSLGGRMGSARLGNRPVTLGGKNIGRRYALFREFVRDHGDAPFAPFGLNSSRIRDGRIVTFDDAHRWSGLLDLLHTCTAGDLLKAASMAAAIRRDRSNAFLGGPYFAGLARRCRERAVAGHFSRAFCEQVVRPMAVRMNGAEPDEIALGNFGANLAMLFDSYEQLENGLEPLFQRFAQSGPLRLGARVESLIVRAGRVVGVRVRNDMALKDMALKDVGLKDMGLKDVGLEELACDHVVLALPACLAADLVRPHAPTLARTLGEVRYFPVGVVVAAYDRPIFAPSMRALVFPAGAPLSNAGAYGPDERHIVRYTFSGAAARALLARGPEIEHLLELGERTLARHIPVDRGERVAFVGKTMRVGLCAYARDHAAFVASLDAGLGGLPGLALTGDYLQGASIEACFRASRASAQRIAAAHPGALALDMCNSAAGSMLRALPSPTVESQAGSSACAS